MGFDDRNVVLLKPTSKKKRSCMMLVTTSKICRTYPQTSQPSGFQVTERHGGSSHVPT